VPRLVVYETVCSAKLGSLRDRQQCQAWLSKRLPAVLSLVVLETASSVNLTDDALLDAPPKVLLVLAFPSEDADVGLSQGRSNLVLGE